MKRAKHLLLKAALVTALLSSSAHAQMTDFPTECEMDSPEQRHQSKFERYALDTLPSVLDSCAFGDRINDAISGAMNKVFDKLSSISFSDRDFFCGFGTKDVWAAATRDTQYESRDFNRWRNDRVRQTRRQMSGYNVPWVSRPDVRPIPDNVFQQVFGDDAGNSGG